MDNPELGVPDVERVVLAFPEDGRPIRFVEDTFAVDILGEEQILLGDFRAYQTPVEFQQTSSVPGGRSDGTLCWGSRQCG